MVLVLIFSSQTVPAIFAGGQLRCLSMWESSICRVLMKTIVRDKIILNPILLSTDRLNSKTARRPYIAPSSSRDVWTHLLHSSSLRKSRTRDLEYFPHCPNSKYSVLWSNGDSFCQQLDSGAFTAPFSLLRCASSTLFLHIWGRNNFGSIVIFFYWFIGFVPNWSDICQIHVPRFSSRLTIVIVTIKITANSTFFVRNKADWEIGSDKKCR